MTRGKRQASEEERRLFQAAFAEARPLAANIPAEPASAAKPSGKTLPGGLDGQTSKRLRRGAFEPEEKLDLHGRSEAEAHRALLVFLRGAQRRGARLVLVVTGKGARPAVSDEPFDMERDSRPRGVLKNAVPRWLAEPAFAALIADTREAHRRHGGAGALYIYLRKNRVK